MIISKEADEIDFVVVNRRQTEKQRTEESRLVSEAIALYRSLAALGYSEEEIQAQFDLNTAIADNDAHEFEPATAFT